MKIMEKHFTEVKVGDVIGTPDYGKLTATGPGERMTGNPGVVIIPGVNIRGEKKWTRLPAHKENIFVF